jgi:hypothetical protein
MNYIFDFSRLIREKSVCLFLGPVPLYVLKHFIVIYEIL